MNFVEKHYQTIKEKCKLTYNLKPEQKEILNYICNGEDVFVSLPTGFGKTICLALQPLLLNEVCIFSNLQSLHINL